MARAYTLKGSGDFDGGSAVWRVLVVGAGDQSEAYDKAAALAPAFYLGAPRGAPAVADQGGGLFEVTFQYTPRTAGEFPPVEPGGAGGTEGNGGVSPPERSSEDVGTDLTFTFGGDQQRIYVSKETKWGGGRTVGGQTQRAPGYLGLIGYNPKDQSVEGCEVYARSCDFSVTKRYQALSYGFLARLFAQCATTNKKAFRGMAAGEVLYIGADGGFKGGAKENLPWEVSGKFKYSPSQTEELIVGGVGGIKVPAGTIGGHDHLWFIFKDYTENVGDGEFKVSRPEFGYVERVYDPSNFGNLGMDT